MLGRSLTIFAAKLIGYGLRLLLPYVLVRTLTVADFGAYRQFFLLEVYIAALFQFGVNQALYYFVPRDPDNAGAYLVNSLLFNVVAYAAAFAAIGASARSLAAWLGMPILVEAFWPLAGYTLLIMLTVAGDCFLVAQGRVRAAAAFEIAGQVLASAATLGAAYVWRDVHAVVRALVLARAVSFLAMAGYLHLRLHALRARRRFFGLRAQIRHGVTLGAAGTVWVVLERLHEFLVTRRFGTEAYAVYAAGCTEIPILSLAAQSLAAVALVEFARLEQAGDWPAVQALWRRVLATMTAVAVPVTLLLVVFARPLVVFLFTPAYAAAVPIFQLSALSRLHLIHNATLVLRAMDRSGVALAAHAAALLVAPPLLWWAAGAGGMVAVAAANAALLVAGRLFAVALLNRVAGAPLAYWASPAEVLGIYAEAARRLTRRRVSPAGPGA